MKLKLNERLEMTSAIVTGYQAIPVLFENDDIIAEDKPDKLASIHERKRENVSLLKNLSKHWTQLSRRLNKQVSG
jgi:23S rRNA-/tRNA-specific pseudouridylate synthase